jgi:LacI family transcriptional regulator
MKKEITIYDIADSIGFSPTTVSRALNNHPRVKENTKIKIFEAAAKLGYQSNIFASNLRRKHTFNIGVIVPRLNSPFQSSALAGMEKVASQAGYNLIISQSLESLDKEIANTKTMFNSRVDGLLVSLAADTEAIDHFEPFFKKEIPVIFFDRVPQQNYGMGVVIDNEKAAFAATSHLIEQGCQRIAHALGNLKINVYADRLRGYKQALEAFGIPHQSEDVILTDLSEEAGEKIVSQLMKLTPLPDGLMVSNDSCAASCLVALKKRGIRVPEEIALLGFNNDVISRMVEPNLTTVSYPGFQIGEVAMEKLLQKLVADESGLQQEKELITLPFNLLIRASTLRQTFPKK